MKTRRSTVAHIVFFITLIFIAGSPGNPARAADETTAKEAREKTVQALKAIGSYTAEQRDEAVRKAGETLADMDARIERLETQISQKWDQTDQAARTRAQQALTGLRKQRTKAAEWYGALQHSSNNAWKDVKSGFIESYHAMQDAFDKAAKEY